MFSGLRMFHSQSDIEWLVLDHRVVPLRAAPKALPHAFRDARAAVTLEAFDVPGVGDLATAGRRLRHGDRHWRL